MFSSRGPCPHSRLKGHLNLGPLFIGGGILGGRALRGLLLPREVRQVRKLFVLKSIKILTRSENFPNTCCLRLGGSPWLISAEMLIVLNYNEEICFSISCQHPFTNHPFNRPIYIALKKRGKIPFLRGGRQLWRQIRRWH